MMKRQFILVFSILCGHIGIGLSQDQKIFTLLSPEQTGIHFSNPIQDTIGANILIYEAFYDGGGVAIGDLNNDGLQDLYFTGNQVSDQLYLNNGNLTFTEVSKEAGILDRGSWSTGVSLIDVNQDGWLDIYVCKSLYDDSPSLRTNELYIHTGVDPQGVPQFSERAFEYGVNDFWRSMQATFLDYDKDGDPDLFLVNQPPNPGMLSPLADQDWLDTLFSCRLLENQGEKFVDVTTRAGMRKRGYGLSAMTADFNNDGWMDIYVCNDYDSPDFLYLNQQDGTFENTINQSMPHISYFSMGSDAADINNDGWMDLIALDMVAEDNYRLKANMGGMEPEKFWNIVNAGGHYQYMFNTLQLNQGTDREGKLWFSEIAQYSGVASTDWSWTPLFADFDNDGYKDLFITNGVKKDLRNTDAVRQTEEYLETTIQEFVKANPNAGTVNIWEVIELDKILEIIPSEKLANYMYRNTGKYQFEKKGKEWGLDQLTFSSGAAYGDLDNDGDLDLVVSNVDEVAYVYENTSTQKTSHHFLRIRLTDQQHRSLIGTRIHLQSKAGDQYAELANARGFYSDSEDMIHFGLGNLKRIPKLVITWPSGESSELRNLKADQEIVVDWTKTSPSVPVATASEPSIFTDVTGRSELTFAHKENRFDDFHREVLLPHKLSTLGPALACGDANGDGLEDAYAGGAAGQSGALILQQEDGTFGLPDSSAFVMDRNHEDIGAVFLDIDQDGDQDLYVVSGGNEFSSGSPLYQDRLYLNQGQGIFRKSESVLPERAISGSCVLPKDIDQDGDLDLFVGGRQSPASWPSPTDSYFLQNMLMESGELKLVDATQQIAPELQNLGMLTDGLWSDFDLDGDEDLIVAGVWMPITVFENQDGKLTKVKTPQNSPLRNSVGWWLCIEAYDIDQDGDQDYLAGNLGLNYKYKASPENPFSVHYDDFDDNGSKDIVLSYYNFGERFPLRGRSCSSQQIPALKQQFPDYHSFASSSLSEIYGELSLTQALHYEARMFESIWIENRGGEFVFHPLPPEAQFSSINDVIISDLDQDGQADVVLAGNMYHSEVETTRNDGSIGLLLRGQGEWKFEAVPMSESGLLLPYQVMQMEMLELGGIPSIMVAPNNDKLKVFRIDSREK